MDHFPVTEAGPHNSAQKTIHKTLDNESRYLRSELREEMNQRIKTGTEQETGTAVDAKERPGPAQCRLFGQRGLLSSREDEYKADSPTVHQNTPDSQRHGPGTCWCYIAVETLDEQSWFLPDEGLTEQALQLIEDLPDANIILQDSFGNTHLHFLASLNLSDPRYSSLAGFLLIWTRGARLRDCWLTVLNSLFSAFTPLTSPRRHAFGFLPSPNTGPEEGGPFIPLRQPGIAPSCFSLTPPPSTADEGSFLASHARLIQVIQSAYTNSGIEDPAGRNALHCLAEAMLHQPTLNSHRITPSAGRSGLTPLMAFILFLPDSTNDKSKTLLAVLETLVRHGARLEARNRLGETARFMAARLGRKVALTTLLEHGANVHARDVYGRGVLETVDRTARGRGRVSRCTRGWRR
ncbi:hypothetical protein B0T18DRAFT_393271 [Schizothecium vesticola]|uniref:Ankyrin n=1 Tax=Schizothecium vesticola TaxID=314040 RepID=A0AA40EJF1_9PEZI|nr:hypothetical protein B0T18DRAFT_393271 [Schizothecium vesticola]